MGLRLFFLPNFPGATFIQGGTFIPDSRVPYLEIIFLFILYLSSLQIFIVYLPLEFILYLPFKFHILLNNPEKRDFSEDN